MILHDVLAQVQFPDSLAGLMIEKEEKKGITTLIARTRENVAVGVLKCDETTIVDMKVDESLESAKGIIASALLRSICVYADARKVHLSCLPIVEDGTVRLKRFMERFGFREIIDGHMERVPGSVLPLDVLETDSMSN